MGEEKSMSSYKYIFLVIVLLWAGALILMDNPTSTASATIRAGLRLPRQAHAIDYDIIYVRQPRRGDDEHITWPEVFHPGVFEPDSDLVLLYADGSEEVLVDTENGAVTDPFV